MTDKILVLCTCGLVEEARRLAGALIEERLAACINIVPGIQSVYRWQGAVEEANEVMLLIKTSQELFERLASRIRALHSYEVPEVIALSVATGSEAYLSWFGDALKPELDRAR